MFNKCDYVLYSLGGGIVDILRCKGFVNNSRPIEVNGENKNYYNLRSQCYDKLSAVVNNNEMWLKSDEKTDRDGIVQELEQIKRIEHDKDAKFKVISRQQIFNSIQRSPDETSCLMMRMFFELSKPRKHNNIMI